MATRKNKPDPTVMVIFGAGGDLTWRKLIPTLFNLWIDEWIPEKFSILGVELKQMDEEEFRDHLLDGVKKNSRPKVSEVCIQFKPVPHQSFPSSAIGDWQPNRLIVRIQPDEGILLRFQAKRPGPEVRLSPVDMRLTYKEAFQRETPEAYETLLLDMMQGDRTLLMRADQVESSWKVVTPILEAWQAVGPEDFPNYSAGSRGSESAEVLIAQDGRSWIRPKVQEED